MPLDEQQKKAIRHMTTQYLRTVGSSKRLLDYAARSAGRSPYTHFVGDGLFAWWDAFMNPMHPDMFPIFSVRELEALKGFDAVIRSFHESGPDREMPIADFVRTTKFKEISDAARLCSGGFKRFGLFYVA